MNPKLRFIVGFGHHVLALAELCVGVEVNQPPTNDNGWVGVSARQDMANHRCGRGLAVSARDTYREFQAHQLAQHFRPANDR